MTTQTLDPLQTEQEAAVAILFACVMHNGRPISNPLLEHISRMLLLCQKFQQTDLSALAQAALPLIKTYGSRTVIEHSAPLVNEAFKQTLFAMVCELMSRNGDLPEGDSEIVGLTALYLGVSIELMRVMITTFVIRNRWNV